jgi:ABC-type lipoprotein export system ATPase subunit
MIKTVGLTKIFTSEDIETLALKQVNFEAEAGEFVAIMGPSGCGKSTFLSILGMLDNPTLGDYFSMVLMWPGSRNASVPLSGSKRSGLFFRIST